MARRELLHKSRVAEFRQWCEKVKGLTTRDGRGPYEVFQILPKGSRNWQVIFSRNYMPEHVTVPEPLVPLVLNFIRSTSRYPGLGHSSEIHTAPGA